MIDMISVGLAVLTKFLGSVVCERSCRVFVPLLDNQVTQEV